MRRGMESFRGRRYYHGMPVLLVALFLLAAGAEKPAPAPEKGAPAQPKKRRTVPTPHPPAGPMRPEKDKTAMA